MFWSCRYCPCGRTAPRPDLLIYEDAFFTPAFYIGASRMGVSFVRVCSYEELNAQLTAATCRAVIISGQSYENTAGWEPLLSYIDGGGHAIVTYAYLQEEPALAEALGVAAIGDFPQGVVESVVQTSPHIVWTDVTSPLVLMDTGAFDNGDRLLPLSGSQSIAEFTGGGSAIVIANEARTVSNGFVSDDAMDVDAMVQLAQNEMQFVLPAPLDCNANGIHDGCDIAWGYSQDCNENGVPDECDIACGISQDANGNGVPDECELRRGDLNCDSSIDSFDVDPFVLVLISGPPGYQEYYAVYPDCDHMLADVNCDGSANTFDIDPFVECLTSGCPPCP